MELIAVNNVQDAYLIKQTLAMHNIEAKLVDEYIVQTAPYLSNAVGGIKIVVSDADFFEAEFILKRDLGMQPSRESNNKGYEQYILNVTRQVPLLNKLSPTVQLFFALAGITMLLIIILILFLELKS